MIISHETHDRRAHQLMIYIYYLSAPAHDSAVMALENLSRLTLGEDVCRLPAVAVIDVPAAHDFNFKRRLLLDNS